MSTTKRPACEECGGKRAHQTHCSHNVEPPFVPPTLDERVKEAAEAVTAAYYFWLGVIEKAAEAERQGDTSSWIIDEFRHRAAGDPEKNARRILTPPQM